MATSVRIQHNGQQLGPYSMDEARRMVLAGEIPASTPGELDGSGDWRALKSYPEFVRTSPAAAGFAPPTAPAAALPIPPGVAPVHPVEEETLWTGGPSQILNAKIFFRWMVALAFLGAALYFAQGLPVWTDHVTKQIAMIGFGALLVFGLGHCLVAAVRLRSTHYLVTTQRVRVTRGLLGRNIQEIELFRVKDTSVRQTVFQRLFGVGDISVVSGDAKNPMVQLWAIPNATGLRERIRHEVILLRQRFGVRELDMM